MPGPILLDGDDVNFVSITIPPIGVLMAPGKATLQGTGIPTVNGKKIGLKGDEKKAKVDIPYIAAGFPVPGTVSASVFTLIDQPSLRMKSSGKEVLLQGAQFLAAYEVKSPAKLITPTGPQMDPNKKYFGLGTFGTRNTSDQGL